MLDRGGPRLARLGPDFGGFDATFQLMQGLFVVMFVLVIGIFIANAVQGARRRAKDNAAPEVTAAARIVDKRVELSGGGTTHTPGIMNSDGTFGPSTSSYRPVTQSHYVTFEQSGGERFELEVPGREYGLLVVGDAGSVTMKGSRYLGFQREILR